MNDVTCECARVLSFSEIVAKSGVSASDIADVIRRGKFPPLSKCTENELVWWLVWYQRHGGFDA